MKEEQTEMDKIVEKMTEYICDKICGKINGLGEEEAVNICCDCELGAHVCNVLNEYNRINEFDNTQEAAVMKKYSVITLCKDCEYRAKDPNGYFWCRSTAGMVSQKLKETDGCSRGKRKE